MMRPAWSGRRAPWLAVALAACAGATARTVEERERPFPAGVVVQRWRAALHPGSALAANPEQCAVPAVLPDRVVVATRAGVLVALHRRDGHTFWSLPLAGASDSEVVMDHERGQLYVGTDEGAFYAVDPLTGRARWSARVRGGVSRPPAWSRDRVFLTTDRERVVALDAASGRALWQYEREPPEGFSIRGHARAIWRDGLVYAGFGDGTVVALHADSGEVAWSRSLAAAAEQYADVDAMVALDGVGIVAASYSGGLYLLSFDRGEVRWRQGLVGVVGLAVDGDRLLVASPLQGFAALDAEGHTLWRQGLADAGDLTAPRPAGPHLLFSGSRAGLFVVDRRDGVLREIFNPGRGSCAPPVVDETETEAYLLANSGTLYALSLRR